MSDTSSTPADVTVEYSDLAQVIVESNGDISVSVQSESISNAQSEIAVNVQSESSSATLNVTVAEQGPPGPPGPPGEQGPPSDLTSLGGIPIALTNLEVNDVLRYEGDYWVNVQQLQLTDGGNF